MAQTCYRHPDRETGVSCSSCGRPICPECMTPTPVGMRCPECARERTRVTRGVGGSGRAEAPATFALIAINVAAYLAEIATGSGGLGAGGTPLVGDFGLAGVAVADGEWYRLLTSGFLHASLLHLGFNMFALFFLGRLLEPGIGTPRFLALYFASLFAGSFGAVLLSDPFTLTIGASGAVFGIFGATFVIARHRGIDALASSIGLILLFNLVITFGHPQISIGGHLGGLAGGFVCGLLIIAGERDMLGERHLSMELLAMAAVAFFAVTSAIAVA